MRPDWSLFYCLKYGDNYILLQLKNELFWYFNINFTRYKTYII